MKSIFHVFAANAEDLRREVVAWHRDQERRVQSELQFHKRPNQATIAALNREIYCHRSSAAFWSAVHIDAPPQTPAQLAREQAAGSPTTMDES
jgi:hypothetical protein